MRTVHYLVVLLLVRKHERCWILLVKTLYEHNLAVTNIQNRNNHFVGNMTNSLFSLCLHSYVLSSSAKLELVGWGSDERNKQQGGSEYAAGTHFMVLDVSKNYQSQIHWPLEHFEISVAFGRSKHGELCSVACIYCVFIYIYIYTHTHTYTYTYTYTYYSCEYLVC